MKKRRGCCATAIEATGRLSWCRKKCEEGFETGESAAKARFAGFSKMRSVGLRPVVFGPGTLWRTWGTRPVLFRFGYDANFAGTGPGGKSIPGRLEAAKRSA
jgi:hypothetical protein